MPRPRTKELDVDHSSQVVGERLRELRKLHGLTQEEVSQRLGWAQNATSQLEMGLIKWGPTLDKLQILAHLYGMSTPKLVDYLGYDSDDEFGLPDVEWQELAMVLKEIPPQKRRDFLRRMVAGARGLSRVPKPEPPQAQTRIQGAAVPV